MTKQRFIRDVNEISDSKYNLMGDSITGNETDDDFLVIGYARTQEDAESLCDLLNELNDKNERLQSYIQRLADMADDFQSMAHELDEENTRLKVLLHKKRTCSACKNLCVIVSERSDYWCSCKDEYMNLEDFYEDCESYKMDNLSLREKEDKMWD